MGKNDIGADLYSWHHTVQRWVIDPQTSQQPLTNSTPHLTWTLPDPSRAFFPSTLRMMRRSTCPQEGASPGLWSSRDWEAGGRPESKISSSLSHSHISFQPSQIILRVKIGGDRGWKLSEVLARPPLRGFQWLLFAAESIRVLFDSASLTVLLGGMSVTYFVRFF